MLMWDRTSTQALKTRDKASSDIQETKQRQMAGSHSQPITSGAFARLTNCEMDSARQKDGVETATTNR